MTEEQLKAFIINLIEQKEQQDENFIRYSFFELKVENGLTETEIDEVLRVSRDYFENNFSSHFSLRLLELPLSKRVIATHCQRFIAPSRTTHLAEKYPPALFDFLVHHGW